MGERTKHISRPQSSIRIIWLLSTFIVFTSETKEDAEFMV